MSCALESLGTSQNVIAYCVTNDDNFMFIF